MLSNLDSGLLQIQIGEQDFGLDPFSQKYLLKDWSLYSNLFTGRLIPRFFRQRDLISLPLHSLCFIFQNTNARLVPINCKSSYFPKVVTDMFTETTLKLRPETSTVTKLLKKLYNRFLLEQLMVYFNKII